MVSNKIINHSHTPIYVHHFVHKPKVSKLAYYSFGYASYLYIVKITCIAFSKNSLHMRSFVTKILMRHKKDQNTFMRNARTIVK